ncbi:PH domain-containing protein [Streptomyces sp. NBC_01298]|uniref:PH domain-containing protein n=1 Tax=Streptomyces sp. NBC_01298 TaxID=2903817 RepID=UPI002E0D47A2|nr:PH domain-containing protein [Streptomyces sp. NBC_01298]
MALPVLTGLFIVFVAYARPRRFTVLDERGIAVRNFLRVRRLRWAELYDIRAEVLDGQAARLGGLTVQAYAYRADGKRLVLPCLDDREQPAVRREATRIRMVWTELRGPQWRLDPQAESRIARDAARRERRWAGARWERSLGAPSWSSPSSCSARGSSADRAPQVPDIPG